MIISLDKYKATSSGSGGAEVVSSSGELTMKEFIEEVRRHNDGGYKYDSCFVYDEYGNYIYDSFYRSDSIIPYTNQYSTDEPLHEVYYDSNNSRFDFIRNERGDVANVIRTDAFNYLYQTKVDGNKYVWNFKSYNETIPVVLGQLCQKVSSFSSHSLSNFTFGYASVYDESNNSSDWVQPCEYYMTKPNFDEENWDSFDVVLNDSDNSSVDYKDGHGLYGSDYEIRGLVKVIPAANDYGWYGDIPDKINIDKFVLSDNNGPIKSIGFMSSKYVPSDYIPEVNINELAYLYGDIVIYNRLRAYQKTYSYTYRCYCNIGSNLDYNLEIYDINVDGGYNKFIFDNTEKIKRLNIKLDGYDETSQPIFMSFKNCKNLEKINFDYSGPVKLIREKNSYSSGIAVSLESMFSRCSSLTSIPQLDTSDVTHMDYMFNECSSLTSIPQLDTSNVTYMDGMFSSCSSLTSIPLLDTSKVTNMSDMFGYCTSLTSIPELDTSNVTDMDYMFNGCSSLTSIPEINTSKATSMQGMFMGCSSLTSIPQLDTSNVTYMGEIFRFCSSLTSIPEINTSKITNLRYVFNGCSSLTSIPQLDTSNVTYMDGMFSSCSSLTSIPLLDTSKVTNMSDMFGYCTSLTSIPELDTSNVTSMSYIFDSCSSLTSIPLLDTSKVTSMGSIFGYRININTLTDIGGFKNLSISITSNFLDRCPNLTVDSLMNVINNLATVSGKTLKFGQTNLDKLTAEQIAIATAKGWTLTA